MQIQLKNLTQKLKMINDHPPTNQEVEYTNKPSAPRFKLNRLILLSNVSHIATSWKLGYPLETISNSPVKNLLSHIFLDGSQLTPEDRQKDCQGK